MRQPLIILAAVAVVAALAIGIAQTSDSTDTPPAGVVPSPAAARAALAGAPAELAEVHALANALLPAGELDARLEQLRGHPVVVNIWGSWCAPCREEFPVFQRVAIARGKEVAFLGVATEDSEEAAGAFLKQRPLTYPSYMDFDGKLADSYGAIGAPATVFYDAEGNRTYFHQGKYETDADLIEDIERYAGA